MIANATGFPVENISILAYDEPIFQYSTGKRTVSDYLQIDSGSADPAPAWLCGIPQYKKRQRYRAGGGAFGGEPVGVCEGKSGDP